MQIWVLGVMKKITAESYRHLLIVLFFLFEALLVPSCIALCIIDAHKNRLMGGAFGIIYFFSFVGQLIVCFLLRRIARPFAIVGWFTLFAAFWIPCLLPVT
jgi:hypothetical protein